MYDEDMPLIHNADISHSDELCRRVDGCHCLCPKCYNLADDECICEYCDH